MPVLDRDASDVITGSEHILKANADRHSLTATAIVDLIKNVLKNPEFNADEVDTDMLQRLQAAIDSVDLQVIDMHARLETVPKFLSFSRGPWKRCYANSVICV